MQPVPSPECSACASSQPPGDAPRTSHTHLPKPTCSQEMEMITGCYHTPLRPLL